MLKKNNFFILSILLLEMTSCCRPNGSDQEKMKIPCTCQETIEIPSLWQSKIPGEMTSEDPFSFLWWEALNDSTLTSLITDAAERNQDVLMAGLGSKNILLKTINDVSADIAKNYIELRGLQMRLKNLNDTIEIEGRVLTLNQELTSKGFFGAEKENEGQKNLESLLVQRPLIVLSMEKIVLHLSTLLSYPPRILNEILCDSQALPDLPHCSPLGSPEEIICRDPSVTEARTQYEATKTKQSFYSYQKVALETLENAEAALAAFNYAKDKLHYLEIANKLAAESYRLTHDLNAQGLKDDRELLLSYQAFLAEENSLIQGKIDLLTSYINLYHAISFPWEICCDCS